MEEPGLDRAEWESEWAALEPLVVDSPEEALPELDRLVRSMLVEVGYPLEEGEIERMTAQGIDPDVRATYLAAHDIVTRAERGPALDAENVTEAVRLFRELYEHLLSHEVNVP